MTVVATYNPTGISTAGKSRIVVMPAVANLNAITLAEWNAGMAVECATEAFGTRTNVSFNSRKKLCDTVATQNVGERTYEMASELRFTLDDPQSADGLELMNKFGEGDITYIGHRPALTHTDAAAADQKYEAIKAEVAAVDLAEITTDAGQEYEFVVQLAIKDRTKPLFASLVA